MTLRRTLIILGILAVFGAIRMPMERSLDIQQQSAYFRGTSLDLKTREKVSQMTFIAALSGFRSLAADALWIEAHTAWERLEWGRMARLFDNVTTLQPRVIMFWDMASWHMAWNASVAAMDDPDEPREALRRKAQKEYFALGKGILEEGIRNNPDRYELYQQMGNLLKDKYKDPCAAYEYFKKAATFPDAPAYEKRFAAYELARCPGKEKEAYAELVRIYNLGQKERLPTLLTLLGELEEKLEIPDAVRLGRK